MDAESNPRAVIGDNESPDAPDYARLAVRRMESDYGEVAKTVAALLDEARELPEITNDETKGRYATVIKRFRDLTKRLETFHAKEKEAPYRTGQGIDQFFFGLIDKCSRRDKKNKPGASDVLLARLNDYDTRKLAEEQARRKREADEAERIARLAREEQQRKDREAEEARQAAERARAPAKVEEKTGIAVAAEEQADAAKVETTVAEAKADDAHIATLAKPADIMRMRDAESGTLSTMATEPYAELVDRDLLDKAKLWPFLRQDAIEIALRAWAKTVGHTQQMDGASIGKRPRSVVR